MAFQDDAFQDDAFQFDTPPAVATLPRGFALTARTSAGFAVGRGTDLRVGATAVYSWDWSDLMTALDDTLTSSSWTVETGLTQVSHGRDADVTSIKVTAASAGESRAINTVVTDGGLTFVGVLCITVRPA